MDVKAKTFGEPLLTVPEDHGVDGMRFNDGKGSPGGAFIVGRMHASWRNGEQGRLYRSASCFNYPCKGVSHIAASLHVRQAHIMRLTD